MKTSFTRRSFLSFFVLGSLASLLRRKASADTTGEKKAMFWRKK